MVVQLNGERLKSPSCWEELKTRHYQRMVKEWDQDKDIADRDFIKLFSILTDTDRAQFDNTLQNHVKIEAALEWVVFQNFSFKTDLPKILNINGDEVEIPGNLKKVSIGANIKARQLLDKSTVLVDKSGNLVDCDCYSMIVAYYLQPFVRPYHKGGFNAGFAEQFEKEIAELPICLVRPIGFFLLNNVLKYGRMQGFQWRVILTNLIKLIRRMFQTSPRFSVSSHTLTFR